MKIEIDLNDILGDEYGSSETLAESVRRQVIENLTKTLHDGIGKQIQFETARVLNEEMAKAVAGQMPAIIEDLMNTQYQAVDRYGTRAAPTTFRAELIKTINEQMHYKKESFDDRKNAFTKAVDSLVGEKMTEFKAEFVKQVDAKLIAEATQHVATSFAKKFGVLT